MSTTGRTCSKCDMWKAATEFYRSTRSRDGLASSCKDCTRAYKLSDRWRDSFYRRTYGVTLEWYDSKLAEQGGGCAACGGSNGGRPLFVDHDHVTGQARAPLCLADNTALGMFKEDIEIMQRAIAYLEAHLTKP